MTASTLKNEIAKALSTITDKLFLQALYTIVHNQSVHDSYELSPEDTKALDARKKSYKSGKAKVFTMGQVRKKITKEISA